MWNPSLVRGQIHISVRCNVAWVQPFGNRHVTCSYTFTFLNFSSLCTEVSQHELLGLVGLGVLDTLRGKRENKGMFGNCFFPLFSVFKNNFLFLRLKNLFGNSKWAENKNCFQNSICEEN